VVCGAGRRHTAELLVSNLLRVSRGLVLGLQAVKEAALAQDALKVIVDLVAEPLARHPRMSDKVNAT
jgi:hypothetical protein